MRLEKPHEELRRCKSKINGVEDKVERTYQLVIVGSPLHGYWYDLVELSVEERRCNSWLALSRGEFEYV